jgi:N-acetyl-alpha-D-glucosaminyl L-malate synthase BshA
MGDKSPVLITTLHGTDITLVGSHPSFFPITKFSIEQSDGVTSVSNYLKRTTHEVFTIEKDIRVIYNFIDTEKYVPRTAEDLKCNFCSREEKVLMHISNFRPVKRVMDVVDIFYEVQKEVNCRLVLIGDGEDRAAAIRSAWNRGLSDRVIFLGKQDNVEDLIPMADVFLFPSANESFGLAALEALSCGVPVVGTRSGGLPEVVEDGRCGYLHPVGAVKEMAASVIELLNNRERMEEFRSNARNRAVENFNQKTIITHYERYYEEVVNAKRAKV